MVTQPIELSMLEMKRTALLLEGDVGLMKFKMRSMFSPILSSIHFLINLAEPLKVFKQLMKVSRLG